MPGHPDCSPGEVMTDADRKRIRLAKNPQAFKPTPEPPKADKPKVGRPRKEKVPEILKAKPKTVPIKKHPYILWLAEQWEDADAQIECLKNKQDELKEAAQEFEKTYPQDVEDSEP